MPWNYRFISVLARISITMTTATLKKTKYLIRVSYIFRRMWRCKYMTHVYCASWGQKRAGFPGSVLQVVVSHLIWVLDTKFWSSGVARIALNCWATFPVPHLLLLVDFIKGEFFYQCYMLSQGIHKSPTTIPPYVLHPFFYLQGSLCLFPKAVL